MIVSIHQPAYLPWIGYFNKIINSDIFVYLDTVQFQRIGYFCVDKDTTDTNLVFNRTVTLRDSWKGK